MNKIQMVIKEMQFGRTEVSFRYNGDVWEWFKKNKKKNSQAIYSILEEIRDGEVHEFMYETQLNKFIKKNKEYVDEIVTV
ncbi:hypothetical protein JTF06_12205 [Desemzia sp. RIT804]|uniref:hypothetical protein n=1 Tax=Desemzia sp. RIT 804 TaxID=2810209 RepID=UPI00194F68F8|nr:hypothetical protein [Desemzia sp. RIT 804]MBM6615649.1 hypothetical protein [Desemzia sp. RIT 804]